ncbi:MAG: ParB/RepB/Spo0J family partition protein [Litoreibacter sp.]
MTKRHDDVFDAVLSGVTGPRDADSKTPKSGARFLKRGNAISDRLSGELEEKTLRWIDPVQCKMWDRHNRDYALLTEDNCRDLIDGIKSQGRQEFPAIVRQIDGVGGHEFEVICGARRHFAVTWLQANNYPQFKYLVEVRDLSDEEAFRLADIENRDREDISDYERAVDYASALNVYYSGKQKAMAARLEVSEAWLSRYLNLSKLPREIIAAFASKRDIRELHARTLKPLILKPSDRSKVFACALSLSEAQEEAREGRGLPVGASQVVAALKASVAARKPKPVLNGYVSDDGAEILIELQGGRKVQLEVSSKASREQLEQAFKRYLVDRFE